MKVMIDLCVIPIGVGVSVSEYPESVTSPAVAAPSTEDDLAL
jgi:uncharacterized protein YqgV (UPF0045/DUF77 family)